MNVHSFESLAALDGEGLRYAVFLTGCPLRCVYCHNPDTRCVPGHAYTPEQLLCKIRRYRPYFGKTGGVTFSGGEPLLQAAELRRLCALLRQEGIGYTLDTSGAVELTEDVKAVVEGADLVICDLKFSQEEAFAAYTGGTLSTVRAFLDHLCRTEKRTWIRTVIVPGLNDSEEAVREYAAVVRQYPNVVRYELLGFHTMGFFKYRELGLPNPLADTPALDPNLLSRLQAVADREMRDVFPPL